MCLCVCLCDGRERERIEKGGCVFYINGTRYKGHCMKAEDNWLRACCSITLVRIYHPPSLSLFPSLLASLEIVQTWLLANGVSLLERAIQSCCFLLREEGEWVSEWEWALSFFSSPFFDHYFLSFPFLSFLSRVSGSFTEYPLSLSLLCWTDLWFVLT